MFALDGTCFKISYNSFKKWTDPGVKSERNGFPAAEARFLNLFYLDLHPCNPITSTKREFDIPYC